MDDKSDPNIVQRLNNYPPFDKEPEEQTPDAPPVDAPEETQEEIVEETPQETEEERKKRTTEEFEKLKAHNAELKKALEEKKAKEPKRKNALDDLIPEDQPTTNVIPSNQQFPTLTNKEIKDAFANLTDEQGYVDTGLLKETLNNLQRAKDEAIRRADEAEKRAKTVERRQDDFERKQTMREVHARFPKLDPENTSSDDPTRKFDEDFYDLFQGEVVRQWSSTGKADPMQVAEKISRILYNRDMTKADKEKADKADLAKRNINALQPKPGTQREAYTDTDDLVKATRLGKKGALAERIRRAGQ
jgi:hypothetical protein